ncbi:MAG: FtsX-like permease family protein [bacterium]|nr:FtsX-like permease family protein [bacterium]
MKTPLAWYNLTSNWNKCALAATGVGFAVALMFMQIGFQRALIDNNVRVLSAVVDEQYANLVVISRARYNLSTEQRFPRSLLQRLAGDPRVESFCAFNIDRSLARVQVQGHAAVPIRVVAIELAEPGYLAQPQLHQDLLRAEAVNAALVDRRSKLIYGFARDPNQLKDQWVELNGRALPIAGQFELGTDFGNDGTLLMSARLHATYFPFRNGLKDPADSIDIGLLHAATDHPEELAAELERLAPSQIMVKTTTGLIEDEKRFWNRQTPIGRIFLIGTIMGLVVGAIICYQIQFTDITDNMPEFATLKAMGYGTSYFWSVILSQSFYLACLGFLPGLMIAQLLYMMLSAWSGLIMEMSLLRIAVVFLLTLLMCATSGALAIRKLFRADPASLF